MPAPMTCDNSNHDNDDVLVIILVSVIYWDSGMISYILHGFHFHVICRDPRRRWWLRLGWGSHSRDGDITKLTSDWTRVWCWHYLHESTNNFQCLASFFSKHSQFSPLCCLYNNSDSVTNMRLLPGFPYFCLMAFWHLLYKGPYN